MSNNNNQPSGHGTVSTPNVELLDRAITHIETHPDDWSQGDWSSCLAAVVVITLSGGTWFGDPTNGYVVPVPDDPAEHVQGNVVYIRERAIRLLGLTGGESFDPFEGAVDLRDLRDFADSLRAQTATAAGYGR